jgi:hypothetical protein
MSRREIPVTALMNVDGGDEAGTDPEHLWRCERCQNVYRNGEDHDCDGGER